MLQVLKEKGVKANADAMYNQNKAEVDGLKARRDIVEKDKAQIQQVGCEHSVSYCTLHYTVPHEYAANCMQLGSACQEYFKYYGICTHTGRVN